MQSRGVVSPSRTTDQAALRLRIRELAHVRPRFGVLRIWVLLRREGWLVNKKRVRRLYHLEGLQLRMRVRRRKHIALHRGPAVFRKYSLRTQTDMICASDPNCVCPAH